jgi:hypothetical protein
MGNPNKNRKSEHKIGEFQSIKKFFQFGFSLIIVWISQILLIIREIKTKNLVLYYLDFADSSLDFT